MIVDIDEAKQFLRIDHDEDDILIQSLIGAAEEYLINATGKKFSSSNNLARLFCLLLVADWYENRNLAREKVGEQTRDIIESMKNQLKYSEVTQDEVQSNQDV